MPIDIDKGADAGIEDAARLHRLFRRLGIDEIPIRTDSGYVEPLLRFFRLREQRGRRG